MGPKLVEERERKRVQLIEEVTQSSIIAVRAKLEEEARRKIKEERKCFQLSSVQLPSIQLSLRYFSPFVIVVIFSFSVLSIDFIHIAGHARLLEFLMM